jgi:hypothetical protein
MNFAVRVCLSLFATAAGQGANEMTVGKCSCKSECGTSLLHPICSVCDTESGCKKSSDYCTYPGVSTFEKQSFDAKNKYFWAKITEDTKGLSAYPSVSGILTEDVQVSFYDMGDEMPKKRKKCIHGIGAVCQFTLDVTDGSPYTGLFSSGKQEGFIRMGSAVDYSNGGLTPGLGIKFARTGVHSGNYVALHSLDFGQSWNFFASNVSNHIPPPKGITQDLLVKKFNQASQCPSQVGLSDMAKYSQDGTEHAAPKFPFKLFLVPSKAVQTPATKKTVDQVNAEMEAFPIGTTLYTAYACGEAAGDEMTPTVGGLEKACGKPFKLGDMVTTTKCTTSAYGDEAFFIRHQPVEEDWQADQSILEQYDAAKACAWGGKLSRYAPSKCMSMLASDVTVV